MAQVMRYHEYPTSGIGIHTSTIHVDGSPNNVSTRGGDGLGGAYNWGLMDLVPDCNTPGPNRAAIGALCYDAGVAVDMNYTAWSSAAFLSVADANLVNIFGYSNCIYGWNLGAGIGPGLTAMINPNLDYNHPVILGIMPEEDGHAVVCDGYGFNLGAPYHHLNMGWSGQQDAWYNFNDINYMPPGYTYVDDCLYNLLRRGQTS